ncbi:MAG TPA: acyl-CoA dehydrogenase family protein [Candidatus Solibacter sp.]|jgi:acyl-CoA dehydrogenase|nr:acyl-CoA dehydrogenase family protein [Candidatus Solibacter sp.]
MRTFVREEIWPLEVIETDRAGRARLMRPLQEEVKARGLWACHLPPALGGQGYGQVKLGLMNEILGTCMYASPVFGNQAPDSGNSEILSLYGTPEQKKRWMEPLLAGEIRSAFSMTEPAPGAGADPTMLRTTAVLDGDEWVINGHKWFTSNGMVADIIIAMVVTEPDEENPYSRASMILIPKGTPGLNIVRNIPTMGGESDPESFGHSEILYEDCRVPKENLLGPRGQGFLIAQMRLGPGRIHHCMRWLGVARRAFDMLCERALQREGFGGPLARKQTVQNWIADSAAEMAAARLMTLHAAWKIDTEGVPAARKEISMIKFYGAKVLHDVIDRAIQVHGALGFSADLPLEAMYRHARAARIYDGPDEVHRVTLARHVLRDYSAPEGPWPRDHIPTRRDAARRKFADQLEAATANL